MNGFPANAEKPFPGILGQNLRSSSDPCSAVLLLDRAILETGVHFLDTNTKTWICQCTQSGQGECKNGTDETQVVLSDCSVGDEIQCYANSEQKERAVCVKKPRVMFTTTERRPRFDAIYTFRSDAAGTTHYHFWKMDQAGCHPVVAYLNGPIDEIEKCEQQFLNLLKGGFISSDGNKDKYCDKGKTQSSRESHLNGISELSKCMEAYPQFWEKMTNSSRFGK